MSNNKELYVCGGTYEVEGQKEKRFALVKPSGNDSVPYITDNPSSSTMCLCGHHSALYRVTKRGLKKVHDVHFELNELQPDFVMFTPELKAEIKMAIDTPSAHIS